MFPIEIWLQIIQLIYNDKKLILNLRSSNMFLLRVVAYFFEHKLENDLQNYLKNFTIHDTKYKLSKSFKNVYRFYTSKHVDSSKTCAKYIEKFEFAKIVINKCPNIEYVHFRTFKNVERLSIIKKGEKITYSNFKFDPKLQIKYLKFKNCEFPFCFGFEHNAIIFDNCRFKKGVVINLNYDVLKNCEIYQHFSVIIEKNNLRTYFEIMKILKNNRLLKSSDKIFDCRDKSFESNFWKFINKCFEENKKLITIRIQ